MRDIRSIAIVAFGITCAAVAAYGEDLSHSSDERAQEETIGRMRNLGTALMSWLTDNIAASDEDTAPVRVDDYKRATRSTLLTLLVPQYIGDILGEDGWGHDLEVYLMLDDRQWTSKAVMLIRSPGRDGKFDGDVYKHGSFRDAEYDHDLVWADGFFIRLPDRHYVERPSLNPPVGVTIACSVLPRYGVRGGVTLGGPVNPAKRLAP